VRNIKPTRLRGPRDEAPDEYDETHRKLREAAEERQRRAAATRAPQVNIDIAERQAQRDAEREKAREEWHRGAGARSLAAKAEAARLREFQARLDEELHQAKAAARRAVQRALDAALAGEPFSFDEAAAAIGAWEALRSLQSRGIVDDVLTSRYPNAGRGVRVDVVR